MERQETKWSGHKQTGYNGYTEQGFTGNITSEK